MSSSPSGELIPDAIDALLAIANAAKTADELTPADELSKVPAVLDGASPSAVDGSYVVIGVDGEDDIAGQGRALQAGLASRRRQEQATVTCITFASGGNSDMSPYRDAAFAWYRAIRSRIELDPRLDGAVTFAEVVSMAYRPKRSGTAAGAGVEFVVQVTSL